MSPRTAQRPVLYRPAEDVAHREIEGQTLLMSSRDTGLMTLNTTGQFIWRRIAKSQPLPAIVRAFQRQFRVPAGIAERDVRAFVALLERRRLIRRG